MRSPLTLLLAAVLGVALHAQTAPSPDTNDPNRVAQREFGRPFTASPEYGLMTGDLDGDGVEDAVIVAQSKSPLLGQDEFSFRTIDPYDAYFGYGNPAVTAQFGAHDPRGGRVVLIVHSWREAQPKAKFVVLNLPFRQITMTKVKGKGKKGKLNSAIAVEEADGVSSLVFWDGRKYKWTPVGK